MLPHSTSNEASLHKRAKMIPIEEAERRAISLTRDRLARARNILQHRIKCIPKVREPGSVPAGSGIGLRIEDLPAMGQSYIDKYVVNSLKVISEFEGQQRCTRQRRVENLKGNRSPSASLDVFSRAELPEVRKVPLLSRLDRQDAKPPIPRLLKTRSNIRVELFERKSQSADALLQGRLLALKRIACNDPVLERIRLCHEAIDDDWAIAVGEALSLNFQLKSLVLVGNEIGDLGATKIADAVASHPTLTAVALGGNRVGDKTAVAFADAIRSSSTLVVLNLTSRGYQYWCVRDFVCRNARDTLTTSETRAGTADVSRESPRRFAKMAGESVGHAEDTFDPAIWDQSSSYCDPIARCIGAIGVESLAHSLTRSHLLELDLSGQSCGDTGAKALASAMMLESEVNAGLPSLMFLALAANGIGDAGIIDLSMVLLSGRSKLRSLRLAANAATNISATVVAQALENMLRRNVAPLKQPNSNLDKSDSGTQFVLHLDLSMNQIEIEGCDTLHQCALLASHCAHTAYHGNPGYAPQRHRSLSTSKPATCTGKLNQVAEKNGRVIPMGLPLRHCVTGQTDSGRNLMHLRVLTPMLRKKRLFRGLATVCRPYESFLKISSRLATARLERELLGTTPLFQHKKLAMRQRDNLPQCKPRSRLPPFVFSYMLKRYVRHKYTTSLYQDTSKNVPSKAPPATRHSLSVMRDLDASLRHPRALSALMRAFPHVVLSHDALHGRLKGLLDCSQMERGDQSLNQRKGSAILPS